MIDVIIPAYKAHETIKKTLYSISCQRNSKNLKVYIVNDDKNDNYDEEIDFFKKFIKIKELKYEKNMGPGYARQYGIDHSSGDYIVFIDSDDIFSNPLSLVKMYSKIKKDNSDVLCSNFFEQREDNSFKGYFNDWVALHGKMYNRQFLLKNKIRFPNLYAEEDNSFNQLVLLYNPKISYLNDSTYVWLFNEKSLVRNDKYYANIDFKYLSAMHYAITNFNLNKCNSYELSKLSYKTLIVLYYYNYNIGNCTEFDYKLKEIYNIYLNGKKLSDEDQFLIQNSIASVMTNVGNYKNVLHHSKLFDQFLNEVGDIND